MPGFMNNPMLVFSPMDRKQFDPLMRRIRER